MDRTNTAAGAKSSEPDLNEQSGEDLRKEIAEARQSSLVLAGAVLILYSALIQVPSPPVRAMVENEPRHRIGMIWKASEEILREQTSFKTQVQQAELLASVWQIGVVMMMISSALVFVLSVSVYFNAPDLPRPSNAKKDMERLESLHKKLRRRVWVGKILIIMMVFCMAFLTLLWSLFGG